MKKHILVEKRCQTQTKLLVVVTVWKERLYPYPGWNFCCHRIQIKYFLPVVICFHLLVPCIIQVSKKLVHTCVCVCARAHERAFKGKTWAGRPNAFSILFFFTPFLVTLSIFSFILYYIKNKCKCSPRRKT